jgi:hypothetical protein
MDRFGRLTLLFSGAGDGFREERFHRFKTQQRRQEKAELNRAQSQEISQLG